MKRIISLILVSLLILSVFSFTGCGSNGAEVSILWSGEGEATNPNSLINSMERAMYIKNVKYKHYGAEGDLEKQLDQAEEALEKGTAALVVELVSDSAANKVASQFIAQEIVDAAKAKNVPVIFFNCTVDKNIIESYENCVHVTSDGATIADVQAELIAKYIKDNFKDVDKNEDNVISIVCYGNDIEGANEIIEKVDDLLAKKDYRVSRSFLGLFNKFNATASLSGLDLLSAEIILTSNDVAALAALTELQANDYNTDKLKTQFVPIFTVGESVDYKALVLAGRPDVIPENLIINEGDDKKEIKNKDKEIKKIEELMNYYEEHKHLVDFTNVNESELDEMVYTTINVIDSGRISGTAIADKDALSIAVASVVKNIIKGNDTFKNVASKVKDDEVPSVIVEGTVVKVRYTVYPN